MEDKLIEIAQMAKELRDKFELLGKNFISRSEFEELKARIENDVVEIKSALKRPPVSVNTAVPSERKAVFFKWMRGEVLTPEQKALVQDETGQILIPEELESEIYRERPKLTVIRSLATVRTIRTNRIRRRSLTEVQVGWGKLETGATIPESTLVPSEGEDYQYVEDLYGLTKVGEDELMDTDVALESIIVDSFSIKIAEAEDTAFVVGTGHANQQPEGILNGSTVTRVLAGQAGGITADDFLKLIYAVPAQYRKNGAFIMNSKTELTLWLLKDNEGRWLWQPSLQQGRPGTLLGYPVYNQEDIPDIPAAGTAADVAIFGDIKAGYRIIDRLGMTVQRLNELYAEEGMVGFKVHFRVGGGVVRPNALRILKVPASV